MSDRIVYTFTEADLTVLKNDLDYVRKLRLNTQNRQDPELSSPDHEGSAPDVYIAKPSGVDIPALSSTNHPGYGDADIYAIANFDGGTPTSTIDKLTFLGKMRVFNLSEGAVNKDNWTLVWKDKYGRWITFGGYTGILTICTTHLKYVNGRLITVT